MKGDEASLGDALAVLCFMSLEQGPAYLRTALQTLDLHGPLALEAFRKQGPEGFALVRLYGPILETLGDAIPLDQALILFGSTPLTSTSCCSRTGRKPSPATSGTPRPPGSTEIGRRQPRCTPADRRLRRDRRAAPEKGGARCGRCRLRRLLADPALQTTGSRWRWPSTERWRWPCSTSTRPTRDFQDILRAHGAAVIPPIARTDPGPETLNVLQRKNNRSLTESLALAALFASGDNGQATIRTIKNDGLERVAQLDQTSVQYYQFLPLYDVIHLGNVLRRAMRRRRARRAWALVDGCFVITDVLSLAALQPEGAVAAEAVRSEVKAAVREGTKTLGRDLIASGSDAAAKALVRKEAGAGLAQAASEARRPSPKRLRAGGPYALPAALPGAETVARSPATA